MLTFPVRSVLLNQFLAGELTAEEFVMSNSESFARELVLLDIADTLDTYSTFYSDKYADEFNQALISLLADRTGVDAGDLANFIDGED